MTYTAETLSCPKCGHALQVNIAMKSASCWCGYVMFANVMAPKKDYKPRADKPRKNRRYKIHETRAIA